VNRHLAPTGKYLLDAGSGPIQYPEYLTYSEGYQYRVCADMSITALIEARKKIGERGLFVVSDIANLPFKEEAFDGVVTLHTIHHLPLSEHARAYEGLHRVLAPGRSAVVVNGWSTSAIMDPFRSLSKLRKRVWMFLKGRKGEKGMGGGGEKEKRRRGEEEGRMGKACREACECWRHWACLTTNKG
jgi:SAM-dependent methyltransferase